MVSPYRLTRLSAPAVQPVTLAEAKAFVREDGTDQDTLIGMLITSAAAALDGADGELGRCLIAQSWRQELDRFPAGAGEIELRLPPTISVDAISYRDTAGAWQTFDGANWQATGLGSLGFATVRPATGTTWPATSAEPGSVRVTFTAGFGDEATDVPADLRGLILARVATAFGVRESVWTGSASPRPVSEFLAVAERYRVAEW